MLTCASTWNAGMGLVARGESLMMDAGSWTLRIAVRALIDSVEGTVP